ncbi:unnamed protein product [Allacma fusca]|uniref:Uncharacterized protein n=1 Tax=Allacma fusca TaxID=39272 RepID=A0A8J2J049_9HEXA|nr:unnamed protein product [Allacma fusca]
MSRLRTGQANDWRVHLSPEIVINLDNENSHARFAQFVRDLKVIYPEDDVQKKAKEVNKFRKFKFGTETSKDYVVAKKSLFGFGEHRFDLNSPVCSPVPSDDEETMLRSKPSSPGPITTALAKMEIENGSWTSSSFNYQKEYLGITEDT